MNASRKADLKGVATAFLNGEIRPLEAALELSNFEHEDPPENLSEALIAMVAVVSETDDIPLGERRSLWHPDVQAAKGAEHDRAQEWAAPIVRDTCEQIVAVL